MSPKAKVSKEAIVSAAFDLIRTEGHEALNTRALAAALGCSTQPLLYHFPSMEHIRRAAYRKVDDYHSRFLMEGLETSDNPLLQLGLNYVRFGHEEPRLFRFLFQTNEYGGQSLDDLLDTPEIAQIMSLVATQAGVDAQAAHMVFLSLFIAALGYASLLANNAIDYDETLVAAVLTSTYMGATVH